MNKFIVTLSIGLISFQASAQTLAECLSNRCLWEPVEGNCMKGIVLSPQTTEGRLLLGTHYTVKQPGGLYESYSNPDAHHFLFDPSITSSRETELAEHSFQNMVIGSMGTRTVRVTRRSTQRIQNGIVTLTHRQRNSNGRPEEEKLIYDQNTGRLTKEIKYRNRPATRCVYNLIHSQTNDTMYDFGPGVVNTPSLQNTRTGSPAPTVIQTAPRGSETSPQ
jgi:hypothetical protein